MTKSEFSMRVRKLRNDKGLSMSELADRIGVNKSRVNMWENGNSVPNQDILIILSKEFNVSIDYLLGNELMENKKPQSKRLRYLQRNLEKMDEKKLKKTEDVLKSIFDDLFEDGDNDN